MTDPATPVTPVAIDPPMMYDTNQRLSLLIHGPSKMGKSTLSSTAPKPVLVLDAEDAEFRDPFAIFSSASARVADLRGCVVTSVDDAAVSMAR